MNAVVATDKISRLLLAPLRTNSGSCMNAVVKILFVIDAKIPALISEIMCKLGCDHAAFPLQVEARL